MVVLRLAGWSCAGSTATAAQNTAAADARMTLRKDVLHNLAGHVGQTEIPARVSIGQLGMVHAELVEQRRVQVVNRDAVLFGLEAEFIRLAVGDAALDTAA